MEKQYLVSARKYRPAKFGDVVGQEALTTTLKNAIASGKLAHAYLFCGPRGVGKTTCARIFAKNINCLNPRDGEACGECESCRAFAEGRSFNIYELDAASNNSVEDIRSLTEQVLTPPQIGRYKVYIIDEVHMLSTAAFNAFLKTLEEPPSYVIFILATTEKHKLLPTILSRCQIYDFNRMEVGETVAHLKRVAASEGIEVEDEALNLIARKADGGMRDALSIFDQVASYGNGRVTYEAALADLNVLDYEYYFKAVDLFKQHDVPHLLVLLDEVVKKGFDPGQFISGLGDHLRNLLMSRDAVTLPLLDVPDDVRHRYHEQASKLSQGFIYSAMRLTNQCGLHYKQSRNKRFQVELALIMIAQLGDEGEDPYAGRGPAVIKPLFTAQSRQEAQQDKQPAQPVAQQQPSVKPAEVKAPVRHEQPQPKPQQGRIGFSIKRYAAAESQQSAPMASEQPLAAGGATPAAHDQPVDDTKLGYEWRVFANSMPIEDKAISARMFNMTPRMISPAMFEVKVDTPKVREMMLEKRGEIVTALRKALSNFALDMQVSVVEVQSVKVAISPREKYEELKAKNSDLEELVKTFGLRFD